MVAVCAAVSPPGPPLALKPCPLSVSLRSGTVALQMLPTPQKWHEEGSTACSAARTLESCLALEWRSSTAGLQSRAAQSNRIHVCFPQDGRGGQRGSSDSTYVVELQREVCSGRIHFLLSFSLSLYSGNRLSVRYVLGTVCFQLERGRSFGTWRTCIFMEANGAPRPYSQRERSRGF